MELLNRIQRICALLTLFLLTTVGLVSILKKKCPTWFQQCLRYGKLASTGKRSIFQLSQVPKSWFGHFYVYASIFANLILLTGISALVFDYDVPLWLTKVITRACGSNRKVSVSAASTLLALFLYALHCTGRWYETSSVSVFAKDSKMDLTHYIIAIAHYTGSPIAIISEAPKFASPNSQTSLFRWSELNYSDCLATVIFLWASWHQYKAHEILSNLRKNKEGAVVTQEYKLPHGDWFEYVSCPHMLAEILMYFSLTIILWGNTSWPYIFVWVFVNQFHQALMNHKWYQDKFDDLPKHRKAILPFIY